MEVSSLNGVTATTGRITGTRYPSLRTSRVVSKNTAVHLSGSWSHVQRALANDEVCDQLLRPIFKCFRKDDKQQNFVDIVVRVLTAS